MYRQFLILLTIIVCSATVAFPKEASAETVLTRALIQNLRNLVQLMPQNRTVRTARISDTMTPGDALSTGRSSLAEVRFNDGSMARIGEQAIFRFVTKTRNFKLSNGTVLLLIPPGQGTTGVWTPNATAAIRGSALFMRYIPETKTTVVGALTNSNIEVFNQDSSQRQVLQAGQLAVVVKDKIEALYNFDLKTFYETSELVQGLDLNKKSGEASDAAIALVQAETVAALAAQPPIIGAGVIVNPAFVRRPTTNQLPGQSQTQQPIPNIQRDSQNLFNSNFSSVTQFLENGEISNQQNPQLPVNTEPSAVVSPSSGLNTIPEVNTGVPATIPEVNTGVPATIPEVNTGGSSGNQQPDRGNNGLGDGVGGGGVNNTGNGNGNGGTNNTGDN